MSRFAVIPALVLAIVGLPAAAIAAEEARALIDDPRVTDAIHAWEEWIEYQAAINQVPGVSVGVVHDQELIATNSFGLADPANGRAAQADTLYSICSISKLFTSVAVMQQRDAGKLRLDDPVSQYLDWMTIEDAHPDDGPITLRGVLTHSSGLPRESDYPYWTEQTYPFPTHDQIVARLPEQKTLYPASRYFQYSNLGLTLAGEIVAATSGQGYGDYVRSNILEPLGMTSTFPEIPKDVPRDRLAVGHSARRRDGTRDVIPVFKVEGIAPAAGFASSVEDLARFASWQFRLLSNGGNELLRASTLREMQRVQWVDPDWKTTWGLGFAVSHEGDRTFVSHGGGCPGFYTHFRLQPKTLLGVIVLTNSIGPQVRTYTLRGFDLIGPAIKSAVDDPEGVPERDPGMDDYVGIYDSIWGQSAILRWEDGLAELWLPARDPKEALARLKKSGDHTFTRVRKDDEDQPGEAFVFELADDGQVKGFWRHSNWYPKVR